MLVLTANDNVCHTTPALTFSRRSVIPLSMAPPESPFKIFIPDDKLKLLQQRLALVTFPDELEDSGTKYGAPLKDIQRLVTRWKDGFDWRAQEATLNAELPQFTRDIDVEGFGVLNIHYVHKKSEVEDAVPLLFVHGWPGSFIEVRKILPLLTASSPEHPSFHVVALSLPGYGFSEASKKQGFRLAQYAEVAHKLMLALGYHEYVTQGGDWGSFITRKIALVYGGKHSKAWHTNAATGRAPTLYEPILYLRHLLTPYTAAEKAGLAQAQRYNKTRSGYLAEQSTQPQTLGYSLADSPVGLLAWIYEKLVSGTDAYPWDDDEGPTASIRIYYEVLGSSDLSVLGQNPTIPYGLSYFPKEAITVPRIGGHFAAHEKPQELVDDVRKMFGKGGPAFGVVPRKTSYK
ncbi:Alpha/Beta hydrolase protein [Desarmillaria tabescens]|uniref:Alpha/Beta hydrolase protein n=1 Tax=Armillaria tabescens TaxID=1929756 RepID=A0AA39J5C2_ARMTA|nr:Alpha/Beta hydrolase protein [Desarmillaria tabescens]KAK0435114.1 Alpha/Beta hydrolase protein [Desarmillaria tabescens]